MIDDEVGAHTRVTILAYWKFESVSLQRRVRCELNFGKGGLPMRLPPGLLGARHPRAAVVAERRHHFDLLGLLGMAPSTSVHAEANWKV